MSGAAEVPLVPDRFCLVNDPNTGQCDATLEMWDLGEHSQSLTEAVRKIAALNGGELGFAQGYDRRTLSIQAIVAILEMAPELPPRPKDVHFVIVGEERSCAIRVSYIDPLDTHPSSHPGIHSALGELVGSHYVALKQRTRKKGRGLLG